MEARARAWAFTLNNFLDFSLVQRWWLCILFLFEPPFYENYSASPLNYTSPFINANCGSVLKSNDTLGWYYVTREIRGFHVFFSLHFKPKFLYVNQTMCHVMNASISFCFNYGKELSKIEETFFFLNKLNESKMKNKLKTPFINL